MNSRLKSTLEMYFKSKIIHIVQVAFENNGISNKVATNKQSVRKYRLIFADYNVKYIICKYKSRKIILNGISMINYRNSISLYIKLFFYHKILAYNKSYIREILFYKNIDNDLKVYLPSVIADYHNTFTDIYNIAMKEESNFLDFDINTVYKIIDIILRFHIRYYNDSSCIKTMSLNHFSVKDYRKSKNLLIEMFYSLDNSFWSNDNIIRIEDFLIHMEEYMDIGLPHRTLTHNDLSIRNILLGDKILICDWELAAFQNPEHDLLELIVSIMHKLSDAEVMELIIYYKNKLINELSIHIENKLYKNILIYNILEFAVNKLSLYRTADIKYRLGFVNQLCVNTDRCISIVAGLWE